MSKLERLLNLTAALLETGRPLTAEELRTRVPGYPASTPSFRRAFERDKDDLREMGIPIELISVPGTDPPVDGYRIPKGEYYLADPGLDPDELAALHLAAAAVRLDGIQGVEGLWKLGGAPPTSPPASGPLVAVPTDPRLVPLFGGVVERRVATFVYGGESRHVEPTRLDFRRGRWYLTAWDRTRDAERNYRVDRIQGDVDLSDPDAFARRAIEPAGLDAAPWELGEGEAVTARLLVDSDQALWARQHLGPDTRIVEQPDGAVVFEISVVNHDAFRSFVITFLDHAEILGPESMRTEFVAWLAAVAS